YYEIIDLSEDRKTITLASSIGNFTNGSYEILKTSIERSGLQNGFITLESAIYLNEPFMLTKGMYDISYNTYARIKMNPIDSKLFIGNSFHNGNSANAIFDQVKCYTYMLTDTRTGETIPGTQRSITKDFNSL